MTRVRKAFVMDVKPGMEDEYIRRHNPIWPELERELKAHGASNYSIFLHPGTWQLFAYVEIEDEARWNRIAESAVCQRWWKHMSALMPHGADGAPISLVLKEVFHLS